MWNFGCTNWINCQIDVLYHFIQWKRHFCFWWNLYQVVNSIFFYRYTWSIEINNLVLIFFFFIILLSMEVCKVCWCTCFNLAVVFYRVVLNHPFCIYYYYFIILNFQFTVHVVFFVSLTPWFWRSTSFWVSLWAVRFSQSLISVHFWSRASIIFRHCFLELHHFPTYLHIDVMKGDCQKMLSIFFFHLQLKFI